MRQTEMFLGSSVLSKQKQKESDLKVSHLSMSLAHHIEQTLLLDFHLILSRNLLLFQILLTSLTESLLNVKDQHVQPSLTRLCCGLTIWLSTAVYCVVQHHRMCSRCCDMAVLYQQACCVHSEQRKKKNTQIYN